MLFRSTAEAGRGRFRSWLLAVFRHHLADLHAHATAARRDRDLLLWIDALDAEARLAVEPAAPEAAYDRDWALAVLARTRADLAAEEHAAGRGAAHDVLAPWLAAADAPGAALATALDLSPGAARVALHRLRARWRTLLRAHIRDTVADEAEVDDELRHLVAAATGL